MTLDARLSAVRRLLATRHAAALLLGVLAVVLALFAAAALGARAGAFGAFRWLPLAVWSGALALLGWCGWRAYAELSPDPAALRGTAQLVELELALRRGLLMGVVELARGAPAGMSPALATAAADRVAASLPDETHAWAPHRAAELEGRIRQTLAGALLAALVMAACFWYAGDAAAALVTPARALRAAAAPRLTLTVSARAVKKGGAVLARLHGLPLGRPVLYLRGVGEAWRPIRLTADQSGDATYRLNGVAASLYLYGIEDGAVSDTVKVDVVAPPFVADFAVTAHYPGYLGRTDEPLVLGAGSSPLPVGTVLELRGAASAALRSAAMVGTETAGGQAGRRAAHDSVSLTSTGSRFSGNLVVRGSAVWTLALTDMTGAPVEGQLPSIDVRAVPDSAPVVTVPVPGADTTAPLDLKAVLVVDARDDHGLSRVEVVSWRISRLGIVGDTVVEALAGVSGSDHLVQSQVLDLTDRGLLPGDTVRYFVRAADQAPQAHVGRSPEFSLRLRSLAELRDAVREGADSLASAVSGLAEDQSSLSRRTEDLAAQRSRANDRQPPPGTRTPPPNADSRTPATTGAMPFEQAEEARRVAEEQQRLADRADSLTRELERLARAADEAGLNDPSWRQQLQNLEELMRQAVTPEMRARMEELQRALERLDPQAVQQALRNLTEQQRAMREQLQRSAELFERAALEGSMQTLADNAEALRQAQDRLNRSADAQRDSTAASAEQRRLEAEADSLRRNLEQLAQRLGERGDTASQGEVSRAADSVQQAAADMDSAGNAMAAGERQRAGQQGREAARALQNVPQRLNQQRRRMAQGWRQEVLRAMDDAMNETISLAAEEQRLAQSLREGEGNADARGRQAALEQGINQVARRLQQAAGRNAMVNPRLGSSLAQARQSTSQSREALEGPSPNPDEAADRADAAARGLAQSAYQMMRNRNEVAGSQSGSGMAEAMERMAQLAGQQGGLNDDLGGMLPMLGNGDAALQLRLRELAARQRAIANDMERLGESALPGRPDQMAQEARSLADRLDQGRLDRPTLERQQRLFRRMLDAGRTLQNEDQPNDPERRSTTGRELPPRTPTTTPNTGLRYPLPAWSVLKDLSPQERALVLDYFRRLNARP